MGDAAPVIAGVLFLAGGAAEEEGALIEGGEFGRREALGGDLAPLGGLPREGRGVVGVGLAAGRGSGPGTRGAYRGREELTLRGVGGAPTGPYGLHTS